MIALLVGAGQAVSAGVSGLVLDEVDLEAAAALEEDLATFRTHPVYLGGNDLARLVELPEMSAGTIASLEVFVRVFGPPRDLKELAAVEFVGRVNADYLHPYIVYVDSRRHASGDPVNTRPRATVEVSLKRQVETREGFHASPIAHRSRVELRLGGHVIFRLATDHDAGEAFSWEPGTGAYGPDFVGTNIQVVDVGPIRKLVIGDFTVRLGHGLTIWTGARRSGSGRDGSSNARLAGITAKTGTGEIGYLRGVGLMVGLGGVGTVELFTSKMKGLGNGDTGIHRTAREIDRGAQPGGTLQGGSIMLNGRQVKVGIVASRIAPSFDLHDARVTIGVVGSLQAGWVNASFEASRQKGAAVSWVLVTYFRPAQWIKIGSRIKRRTKTARSVPVSPAADSGLSGGTDPGWLTTLTIRKRGWKLHAFRDYVVGSWFTSTRRRPEVRVTTGVEITARFQTLRARVFLVRDTRDEQIFVENGRTAVRGLKAETATRARMQLIMGVIPSLSLRLMAAYQYSGTDGAGTAVSHEVRWTPVSKLLLTFGVLVFETPRGAPIYSYEPDVGLQYSWSRLDGGGSRAFVMLQVTPGPRMDLRFKFGQTVFDAPRDIGSGLDHLRTDRLRTATGSVRVRV